MITRVKSESRNESLKRFRKFEKLKYYPKGRKKVEWNHMLMQKYNYISEMGSNPPSYDPHRGIDLGTLPAPPPVSSHSIIDDSKMPPFSGASFQPFSLPVSTIKCCFHANYLMFKPKHRWKFRTPFPQCYTLNTESVYLMI